MKSIYCVGVLVASLALYGCADVVTEELASTEDAGISSVESLTKFRHSELLDRQGISRDVLLDEKNPGAQRNVRSGTVSTELSNPDSVDLIIAFSEDEEEINADKMMRRYKMFRRYHFTSAFRGIAVTMHVDDFAKHILRMQEDPSIGWFEPDIDLGIIQISLNPQALLPFQETPWGISDIGAHLSSTLAGNGTGSVDAVNFYVLDSGSGVYDNNVGLRLENYSRSLVGVDVFGHGAHVTGTAVGSDNLLGFVGVAPGSKTWSLKVLNDFGSGSMSSVIAALDRVSELQSLKNTPGVVNLSLGAHIGTTEYTALDYAVDNLVAEGVVVVVAAGNDSSNAALVTPAHAEGAITVGAYDSNHEFASFSNFGSSIDILAPGVDILSVGSLDPVINGAVMSGTSMAAPHVAGAAALYLSQNPSASPARVRKDLIKNARPIVTGLKKGTTNRALWVGSF